MSKKYKSDRPDIPDTQILQNSDIIEEAKEEVTESLSDNTPEKTEEPEETGFKLTSYQYVLFAMVISFFIPPAGMIMSVLGFKNEEVRKDSFLILFHTLAIIIGLISGFIMYYIFIR